MSKAPSLFRETDLKRAVRGVAAAGLPVQRVEIDKLTGNITVYPGKPEAGQTLALANERDA
jgi:hypothetical protein